MTVQPPASRPACGAAGCAGVLLALHRGVLCVTARPGNQALHKQLALGCSAHQGESLLSSAGHVVATGRSGYTPAPNAPVAHRLASWSPRLRSRVSSGALTSNSLSRRPAALSGGCSEPVLLAVLRTLQASTLRGWTLALVKRAAHRRLAHRPRTSQSITSSQNRLMCWLAYMFPCYKAHSNTLLHQVKQKHVSIGAYRSHWQCASATHQQEAQPVHQPSVWETATAETLSAQETLVCRPLRVCPLLSRAQGARTGGATYLPQYTVRVLRLTPAWLLPGRLLIPRQPAPGVGPYGEL